MASYEKIYDLKAEHELPERIFLDKGNSYAFSVFLTVREHSFEFQPERGLWARLEWSPWGGARAAAGGYLRGQGAGPGGGAPSQARGLDPCRCLQCSPP